MDELMMDWLYNELDPPSSARVAEHMGACARCAAEIGALRRTREAFRDLTDVEPPASLSAILLHEAARRGPQSSPAPSEPARSGGFWTWVQERFRPLALHPAATAVATLVLVGGVAGALYVRHGDMGTSSREEPAPVAAPAPPTSSIDQAYAQPPVADPPAKEAALESAIADENRRRDEDGVGAGLLDGERQAELGKQQASEPQLPEAEAEKIPARLRMEARRKSSGDKGKPADSPSPTGRAAAKDKDKADPAASGDVKTRGVPVPAEPAPVTGDDEADDEGGGAEAAPPAQTVPAAEESSAGRYRDSRLSKSEQGWLSSQEGKLDNAVRSRRCRDAAIIANDILDRNADYYTRRVRDSKAVAPCRSYLAEEQSRRSKLRAQKPAATKASRKGGASGQKARAAPERDESNAADQAKE
jgi:hypothetical protein